MYLILNYVFQIFNLPSQPIVAKYGTFGDGEYLIFCTQSVWLPASLVYLHSALTFQSLILFSVPAEKIYLLSAEKAHVKTSPVCPKNYLVVTPALKSQSLKVLSHDDERQNALSFDKARSETK